MNTIKAFLKEKGLYLFCLTLVFAATAVGILAIRSVVRNIVDNTGTTNIDEGDGTWNQPGAIANDPVTDLPEDTPSPVPTSAPSAQPSAVPQPSAAPSQPGGAPQGSGGSAAASGPSAVSPLADGELTVPYSGDELVYHATLGDWRTHNGADYTASAGSAVRAVCGGTLSAVYEDALWGGVAEVTDAQGRIWRYCGLVEPTQQPGATVRAGAVLGTLGTPPAEADTGAHLHLECTKNGAWLDPEKQ